jgi:hypothetical protein
MNLPIDEPQDFFAADGVTYIVTAEDGVTTRTYTVKAFIENIATGTTGECTWTIVDEAGGYVLTISGHGAMGDGDPWYQYNHDIVKIFIEEGVTSIGQRICLGNWDRGDPDQYYNKLTSVTISNSVTSIGYAAFAYCRKITSITIGNSMEILGEYAFYENSSLESIIIPNSVTHIEQGAFNECASLKSITIGSGVTSIKGYAFGSAPVTEFVIYNPTPPETHANVFGWANIGAATLKVPTGSESAYRSAPVWGLFGNIVGI